MGWQMHRNVPSDAALKGYDDEVAARDNEIRRPAQEVFVISDEAYEHMQKRNSQRYRWDIVNIKEIRRRNTFTLAMLLQLLEEKFKSFTDNGELFEQVALGLCRRIPSDFLLYCFLDSMSPEKISHGHYSFAYNAENINDFGKRELSHWYSNEDIYSVFKAISLKKSPSALIADKIQRELEEVNAALELLDLLPKIARWPEGALQKKILGDIKYTDSSLIPSVCYSGVEPATFEDLEKDYFSDLYKELESQWSRPYYLDSNQYEPAKKILNTQARVRAYFAMHHELDFSTREPKRPADKEGLLLTQKILSSIVNDAATKWNLVENILSFHVGHNRLVEVAARIRNETYSLGSLDKEDEFKARYQAAKDINLKNFPDDNSRLPKVAPPILEESYFDESDKYGDNYFNVPYLNYYE